MDQFLNNCPCGEMPTHLILHEGSCSKWAFVAGSCCDEWLVEYKLRYEYVDSDKSMMLAVKAWNAVPRKRDEP